jgi:hypothetical protein
VFANSKSFRDPPKLRRYLADQNDYKLTGDYIKLVNHFGDPFELIAEISIAVK